MIAAPLTPGTQQRLDLLFPQALRAEASRLLIERCGRNLPLTENWPDSGIERIRFAVLKQSGGTIEGLIKAIALANLDWRDLLMAAGFGYNMTAHHLWMPEQNAS